MPCAIDGVGVATANAPTKPSAATVLVSIRIEPPFCPARKSGYANEITLQQKRRSESTFCMAERRTALVSHPRQCVPRASLVVAIIDSDCIRFRRAGRLRSRRLAATRKWADDGGGTRRPAMRAHHDTSTLPATSRRRLLKAGAALAAGTAML